MPMRKDITEAKLKTMVKFWTTMSVPEISKRLRVQPATVRAWAYQLRKKGVPLARKHPGKVGVIENFSIKSEVKAKK
jgi:transposase